MTLFPPIDPPAPVSNVLLVAGGMPGHDYDFARLRLLQLLRERGGVRTEVCTDYPEPDVLAATDLLLTYTCNQWPSAAFEDALPGFLGRGGSWLALHGSNSLSVTAADEFAAGRGTTFLSTLATRFTDHPRPLEFAVAAPEGTTHPIVADLGEFTTFDEFYLMDLFGEFEVLLEGRLLPGASQTDRTLNESGETLDPAVSSPALYTRGVGDGTVVYCALGHCDPSWNAQPVRRCSWDLPVYETILRRSIDWLLDGAKR
jgi:uncharacterized protein